jgi:hypothetical protein
MTVFGPRSHRGDLADKLSELILVMELADFDDDTPEWFSHEAKQRQFQPLRDLQEVEPVISSGIDSIVADSTEEIIDPRDMEVTPSDLDVGLYISTVRPWDPIATGIEGTWIFDRFRNVPQRLFHQEKNEPPTIALEWVTILATMGANIGYQSSRTFLLYDSGKWRPTIQVDDNGELMKSKEKPGFGEIQICEPVDDSPESLEFFDSIDYDAKLALARQFARRYQWRVLFRDHPRGTATLSLVTDPKGAREAFKLRDKPKSGKRRPALKHWVRKHWRRNRSGDGAALVRAHLRGETKFIFEGMECLILPSPYDIERVTKR